MKNCRRCAVCIIDNLEAVIIFSLDLSWSFGVEYVTGQILFSFSNQWAHSFDYRDRFSSLTFEFFYSSLGLESVGFHKNKKEDWMESILAFSRTSSKVLYDYSLQKKWLHHVGCKMQKPWAFASRLLPGRGNRTWTCGLMHPMHAL